MEALYPITVLRVAIVELPHRWDRPERALARVDAALAKLEGPCDLVALAECALTGYVTPRGRFDLTAKAETGDGPTLRGVSDLARRRGAAVATPWVERDGERVFNSYALIDREGRRVGHWRKRHPWFPERWATPGDLAPEVVALAGTKLTAAVCFDLHFIADDAPEALREADALLFPSAWCDPPGEGDARGEMLPELARRFGLWVVNPNWGAGEPPVMGQGGSRVIGPDGSERARLSNDWSERVRVLRAEVG